MNDGKKSPGLMQVHTFFAISLEITVFFERFIWLTSGPGRN